MKTMVNIILLATVFGAASCSSLSATSKHHGRPDLTAWQLEIRVKSDPAFANWVFARGSGVYDPGAIYLRHNTTPGGIGIVRVSDATVFVREPPSLTANRQSGHPAPYSDGEVVGQIDGYQVGILWTGSNQWPELKQSLAHVIDSWTEKN
jgi:hypothetical protein